MTVRIGRAGQSLMMALALALLCLGATAACGQEADWEGISYPIAFGGGNDALPAHADQINPAVACDSTGDGRALVIWEDYRAGEADIFGARLNGAGEILDERAFPIATGTAAQITPALAWGGGTYLAVWVMEEEEQWRIAATRFNADGEMVDNPPIELAVSESMLSGPDLAFGTTSFMVIWNDYQTGAAQTHGVRISADGEILDADPLVLSPGKHQATPAAIAFGGDRYLLAWSRADTLIEIDDNGDTTTTPHGNIFVQFVSVDGEPADTISVERWRQWPTNWNAFGAPALSWSGSQYLAAWLTIREGEGGGHEEVHGRMISAGGVVSTTRLVLTNRSGGRTDTAVASDGRDFFVSWGSLTAQYSGIYGAVVDSAENVSGRDINIIGINYTPGQPGLAWTGSAYISVFNAKLSNNVDPLADHDVGIHYFDSAGTEIGPQETISRSGPIQIPTSVGFNGTHYLTAWDERVPNGWVLRAARVDTDGALLDPDGFLVFPDTLARAAEPTIISGGGRFLLLWTEYDNVNHIPMYGLLMGADGSAPGERQELYSRATRNAKPSACWTGDEFLLAWRFNIPAARDSNGLALGRFSIGEDALVAADTVVVNLNTGSDPLLVFDEIEQNAAMFWSSPTLGIHYLLIEPDTSLDDLPDDDILFSGAQVGAISAVSDGSDYFISWLDQGMFYGARVKTDGTVLDPGRIHFAPEYEVIDEGAIAYDGGNLLAAWRGPGDGVWQIRGSRLASDGFLLDMPNYIFAGESSAARWPVMGSGPPGQVLLVYSAFLPEGDHGILRAHARLWQQMPPEASVVIHQSQGVTSDVSIMVFPSEELANGGVAVHGNGVPLAMEQVDEEHNIYQGWFQAQASHVVNVVAVVDDSTGNRTVVHRDFSIGEIGSIGGTIEGPHGAVALTCAPGGLANSTFLMVLPDQVRGMWTAEDGFTLSPPNLNLLAPVTMRLKLAPRPAGDRLAQPILEREGATGWQPIAAAYWPAEGIITAPVTALGHYRLRWDLGYNPAATELRLAHDAAIWKSNLGITYQLPQTGHVRLAVYDVSGRCVRTLVDGLRAGGAPHVVNWNGRDERDHPVGGGVYFTRLRHGDEARTARSILVR